MEGTGQGFIRDGDGKEVGGALAPGSLHADSGERKRRSQSRLGPGPKERALTG
jgi:hypothetical protein